MHVKAPVDDATSSNEIVEDIPRPRLAPLDIAGSTAPSTVVHDVGILLAR